MFGEICRQREHSAIDYITSHCMDEGRLEGEAVGRREDKQTDRVGSLSCFLPCKSMELRGVPGEDCQFFPLKLKGNIFLLLGILGRRAFLETAMD